MRAAAEAGRPFDARSRSRVVADLRAIGVPAVPRLVPAAMLEPRADDELRSIVEVAGSELLPLSGIGRATTVLCNELGAYAIYESDEHGFRNPPGLWQDPPTKLALIGDSFTIGECVAPGLNVADRLRTEWSDTVNLGYSGHSPLLELATLVEYGFALEPAITLWLYFENDLAWFDLARSARSPLLMRYLDPGFSQRLFQRRPEIDSELRKIVDAGLAQPDEAGPHQRARANRQGLVERMTELVLLTRTRHALARMRERVAAPASPEPDDDLFEAILRRARNETARWQGELIVVFLPGVWHFDPIRSAPGWARHQSRESISRRVRALGLEFVDIQQAFEQHPDPLSLYSFRGESILGSPHMNAAGYAVTAEVLRRQLASRGAIADRPALSGEPGGGGATARPDQH